VPVFYRNGVQVDLGIPAASPSTVDEKNEQEGIDDSVIPEEETNGIFTSSSGETVNGQGTSQGLLQESASSNESESQSLSGTQVRLDGAEGETSIIDEVLHSAAGSLSMPIIIGGVVLVLGGFFILILWVMKKRALKRMQIPPVAEVETTVQPQESSQRLEQALASLKQEQNVPEIQPEIPQETLAPPPIQEALPADEPILSEPMPTPNAEPEVPPDVPAPTSPQANP
jgi:hypothetical protein